MGSGFGGTGFLWWKCSMMCCLIGPHRVMDAHSGDPTDGVAVLAPAMTPKVVPSDTGTILDGSWPGHGAMELSHAVGAMEVRSEGHAEGAGAVEGTHRLALVLAVDVLALDRHL